MMTVPHHQIRQRTRHSVTTSAWQPRSISMTKTVEGLQAVGPTINNSELTDAITVSKTVEINKLCAQTSLQDWLQDHDHDGNLPAQRDTALQHLDPLVEEKRRLISERGRPHAHQVAEYANELIRGGGPDLRRGFGSTSKREERHDAQQRVD